MNNTVVLIPCYKPDEKLLQLIHDLRLAGIRHILVVDDGGGAAYDHIFQAAQDKGCLVYRYEVNKGKGYAIKYGMSQISSLDMECHRIVTADCDGQHTPEDICRVIAESQQHPDDLVLGGRRFTGDVPWRSRFGNAFSRKAFYLMSGARIHDTQTGLRAIPASGLHILAKSQGDRYEYEMNVLSDCCDHGIHIREIPIETVYLEGNKSSHFKVLRDSYLIYKNPIKYLAVSLSSTIIDLGLFGALSSIEAFHMSLPEAISAFFSSKVLIPTIIARVVSAVYNYTMNKRVVFSHKGQTVKTFGQYCLLASIVMCSSALIVSLADKALPWATVFIKALVDLVLFVINYLVQKRIIFRKGKS